MPSDKLDKDTKTPGNDATHNSATGCNDVAFHEGIALWNYGPARRQARKSVGFDVYLWHKATDRLHGLLNRIKGHWLQGLLDAWSEGCRWDQFKPDRGCS